ncbi:uncharacterized protein LOC116738515 [Nasonia vitripennis]|uniref:Uncharacterized protein n=1 Tax=Nasonia vitripennis TaxID=7425 RepID=A0A7M7QUZ4_NASVI|nr:uncharacterized protein LOC116738515 [Nasonia vitripennis]
MSKYGQQCRQQQPDASSSSSSPSSSSSAAAASPPPAATPSAAAAADLVLVGVVFALVGGFVLFVAGRAEQVQPAAAATAALSLNGKKSASPVCCP